MKRTETLRIRERDALLARLRTTLEADPRVVAAWLYGSLGEGEGDAWSDLDVWVVLTDDAYDPALRQELSRALGTTLLTVEAPQNGPSGGTYLMAAHDAPTGPHLIDWYLQPQRHARRSTSRVVLVDREPLSTAPPDDAPRAPWTLTEEEDLANKAALFWAMLLVQAKYVARKPVEDGMGFEGFVLSLLKDVAQGHGASVPETGTAGLRDAGEKLDRLTELGRRMRVVAPALSAPDSSVERFLATVRAATRR